MASDKKQAKRARRAKTKAKQARTVRNATPQSLSGEVLDDIARGLLVMLMQLAEAEEVSQVEMLTALIRETSMSNAESLDDEVDNQILILTLYGRKIEGKAENWMEEAEFLKAYAEAARRVDREELIEAWDNAHDFL